MVQYPRSQQFTYGVLRNSAENVRTFALMQYRARKECGNSTAVADIPLKFCGNFLQ